jgi:peptide/nickel transport system substrate-binding protein
MLAKLIRGAVASALVVSCFAPAHGPQIAQAREAHTLVIGDIQDPSTLNPVIGSATSILNMAQLAMAHLVRYDKQNRAIPELATVVPTLANGGISSNGLEITWHLRKGVKWSDGAPFDADDVVFSTNAINNPRNNVVGRDGWDLITKIDEPDKYTVRFHLKKKYSAYLPTFFGSAGANPCILPKHILGDLPDINTAPYNALPVGIGPFRFTKWNRGDAIELEANPYYFRGKPKLQKIVYKIIPDANTLVSQMRTGEIDLVPLVRDGTYDQMKAIPGHTTLRIPGYYWSFMELNVQHPALADVAVRRALRMAMNRPALVQKAFHGLGFLTEGTLPPSAELYTAIPAEKFDIAGANALLDRAGWKRGGDGIRAKNGVRLELDFASYTGTPDVDVANELIRDTWKQIGVSFTVKKYAQALFFGPFADGGILYGGKWDITSLAYGLDPNGDDSNVLECDQIPPNGQNSGHYCDKGMDAYLGGVKEEYDMAKRRALVAKVEHKIVDDVPYITVRMRDNIFTFADTVTGFAPNALTPFDDIMNVDVR